MAFLAKAMGGNDKYWKYWKRFQFIPRDRTCTNILCPVTLLKFYLISLVMQKRRGRYELKLEHITILKMRGVTRPQHSHGSHCTLPQVRGLSNAPFTPKLKHVLRLFSYTQQFSSKKVPNHFVDYKFGTNETGGDNSNKGCLGSPMKNFMSSRKFGRPSQIFRWHSPCLIFNFPKLF